MIRKQLLIGILAAMTVALPAVGIYAGSAKTSEIQRSQYRQSRDITEFRKNDRPNLCGSQWRKYYVQSHKP